MATNQQSVTGTNTMLRRLAWPHDPPEFDNLEIRCTWSGEYEERADLRISLDVNCVPNSETQLLNTRAPGVYLVRSFIEPLPSDDCSLDSENTGDFPQSPLFAYSPLVSDKGNDTALYPRAESSWKHVCAPETRSISESESQKGSEDIEEFRVASSDCGGQLSSESSVSSPCTAILCANPLESGGLLKSRKRSATDADLTDYGSDFEGRECKEVTRDVLIHVTSPTKSKSTGKATKDIKLLHRLSIPKDRQSHKPSMIPKPTPKTEEAAIEGNVYSAVSCVSDSIITEQGSDCEPPMIDTPGFFDENYQGCEIEGTTDPRSGSSEEDSTIKASEPPDNLSDSSQSTHCESKHLLLDSNGGLVTGTCKRRVMGFDLSKTMPAIEIPVSSSKREGVADTDYGNDRLTMHSSTPQSLVADIRDLRDLSIHHQKRPSDAEECKSSDKPEVKLDEGILVLRTPKRLHATSFRITITASIYIPFGNDKGWSDIVIPGLPRAENGNSGLLLFLMPENHGLEIRTTNLKRSKIVENCFVAEFANSGDLVIPVRRCEKKFYGVIQDFTVEQEIRVSHLSGPAVRCHAMCSLKLHNRCFWSEKCCFFLYINGAPEGCFRSEFSHQNADMNVIVIPETDTTEGVSRIQVTCPPRDLEMFCVTWVMMVPKERESYWLPQIHSVSSNSYDRNRDRFRHAWTKIQEDELLNNRHIHESLAISSGVGSYTESIPRTLSQKFGNLLSFCRASIALETTYRTQELKRLLRPALIGVFYLALLASAFILPVRVDNISSVEYPERSSNPSAEVLVERPEEQEITGIWYQLSKRLFSQDIVAADVVGFTEQPAVDDKPEKGSIAQNAERRGGFELTNSNISFRDRIDYWLGWSGPIVEDA